MMHLRHITYFTWLGEELIMVPNFPAWICDMCGKREYDERAISWLTMLLSPNAGKPTRRLKRSPAPGTANEISLTSRLINESQAFKAHTMDTSPRTYRFLPADVYTSGYRVVGKVMVSTNGIMGILNDITKSHLELHDARLARIHMPTKLVDHFEVVRLVKSQSLPSARRGVKIWALLEFSAADIAMFPRCPRGSPHKSMKSKASWRLQVASISLP